LTLFLDFLNRSYDISEAHVATLKSETNSPKWSGGVSKARKQGA
jgi:hypothetical protein